MSCEQLREAADKKKWNVVTGLVNDKTDVDTLKHVLLQVARHSSWNTAIRLFRNSQELCLTMYSLLLNILTVNRRKNFFVKVFSYVAANRIPKITCHLFVCAIQARSAHSKVAREIVACIGSKCMSAHSCPYKHVYVLFRSVYKFLCKQLSCEDLNVFVTCLKEDGRAQCVYLAVLLSAVMGDWDFVTKSLRSGLLHFRSGARYVFHLAWEKDALECAARLLWRSTVNSFDWINDRWACHRLGSRQIMTMTKAKVDVFLTLCEENKLYDAGLYIAFRAGNLQAVLRLWPFVNQEEWRHTRGRSGWEPGTVEYLTQVVLEQSGIRMALDLLAGYEGEKQTACLSAILLHLQGQVKTHQITKQLILICHEDAALKLILNHIVSKCVNSRLFQRLLSSSSDILLAEVKVYDFPRDSFGNCVNLRRQVGCDILCYLIDRLTPDRVYFTFLQILGRRRSRSKLEIDKEKHWWAVLKQCVAAGICTLWNPQIAGPQCHYSKPFEKAVHGGLLDVVQLLYRAGATSYRELYKLNTDMELQTRLNCKRTSSLRLFLNCAASTPRTLQDLCRLHVSHLVGSHTDRKARALALGLPLILTQKVLLYDALYPGGKPLSCDIK